MNKIQQCLSLGLLLSLQGLSAMAVPVVPNFTQGSMTSRTETTSKVTEVINSIDYNTGYEYTVTGNNVQVSGASLSPAATSETTLIEGVSSTWNGLNLNQKPSWSIVNPGQSFIYTETYSGPGLANQTVIQRTTDITSVTETTSIFSQ